MMLKKISVVLAFLAFASPSFAQVAMSRNGGGSGSSGSSTITNGVTATSGCVAGGVLRSISNLVECGAGLVYADSTQDTLSLGGTIGVEMYVESATIAGIRGASGQSFLRLSAGTTGIIFTDRLISANWGRWSSVGLYVGDATDPTAAFEVNNLAAAKPIMILRDNGTPVLTVADGGDVAITVTSASGELWGMKSTLSAGYTGSSGTVGGSFINSAAGGGTSFVSAGEGNFGITSTVNPSTGGSNLGGMFFSQNAGTGKSISVLGAEISTSGSGQKIGGFFYADTEGSSTIENALTAVLGTNQIGPQSYTSETSAALLDNGGAAAPILLAKDNGTTKFRLSDGGYPVYSTTIPAVSNTSADSCGTTAATIAGTSEVGIVTVGATAGTSCTMTFPAAAPTRRVCVVQNETTANIVKPTASSTTVHVFAGTFVAGDVLAYRCDVY